ncbi:MAG: translation initiation factor IF-2 [Desulfobacterium sp.]|nr:translation initiation factor IF-2 [Desulfobacterium sp.]
MAKIRVYELAKKLNMTNKVLLTKLKAMNIEAKSHMSSLEDDTEAKVRENLYGSKNKITDTRVKSSVIRRRKPQKSGDAPDVVPGVDAVGDDAVKGDAASSKEIVQEESPVKESVAEDVKSKAAVPESKVSDPSREEKSGHTQDPEPVKGKSVEKKTKKPVKPKSQPARVIMKPEPLVEDNPEPEQKPKQEKMPEDLDLPGSGAKDPSEEKELKDEQTEVQSKALKCDKALETKPETEKKTLDNESLSKQKEADLEANHAIKEDRTADVENDEISLDAADSKDKKRKKKKPSKRSEPAKIIKMVVPIANLGRNRVKKEATQAPHPPQGEKAHPKPSDSRVPRAHQANRSVPVKPDPEISSEANVEVKRSKKKEWKKKGSGPAGVEFAAKGGPRKRKSIVEGKDLYSNERGKKGRRKDGRVKKAKPMKTQITVPKAIKRRIKIDEIIELSELAKRMGIKANEMIVKLMGLGVMATVNQVIDYDTASLVAAEFDYEVEKASVEEDLVLEVQEAEIDPDKLVERPPVVTIMGHVDHGKTSLLDMIRKTKVATGEAGGITQHIGAYSVKTQSGTITFLDTPGHAAFTSMRSRGAKVTDLVVLVVAADDGVMPQTIEAINHSKAAGVPVVVAVNKMDKPAADPDRVMRELSDHGLLSEEWGGDVIFAKVSAKTGEGIDSLLEMILLQSDVLELKANPDCAATGHVIEARLDAGRGPVATILINQGTLRAGQPVVCGLYSGKIRVMIDDLGKDVEFAGPSTPVEIVGLSGVPQAGDEFVALESEKDAKQVSDSRMQKQRAKVLAKRSRANLEKLFESMGADEIKELKLIVKADVHGSLEALNESIMKLAQDEVDITIVHAGTGAINESDVSLAAVSDAIIIGFNVRPTPNGRSMAKEENVDMRFYDIIYNVINDIKAAITGLMPSTFHEIIIGRAEVRDTFVIPHKGLTIGGSFVLEGKISRGYKIRLLRDGVVKCDSTISSLRRFKDDVKEVTHGYECGIGIERYNDIKVGDIFECYEVEERKAQMEQIKE